MERLWLGIAIIVVLGFLVWKLVFPSGRKPQLTVEKARELLHYPLSKVSQNSLLPPNDGTITQLMGRLKVGHLEQRIGPYRIEVFRVRAEDYSGEISFQMMSGVLTASLLATPSGFEDFAQELARLVHQAEELHGQYGTLAAA